MYDLDLSLNRVYWKYLQTGTFMRPEHGYWGDEYIPTLGSTITCPQYTRSHKTIKEDLIFLSTKFAEKYADYKFTLALSGGIDGEVTAEAFYQLGIPFDVISLRLFGGANDFDIVYAAKYCKERNISHRIIKLTKERIIEEIFPKAHKLGQFTHSMSQICLTRLFDFVDEDTILVFSGHNPDVHPTFGWGWWEDSPNLVKYAINTNKKFFTFTSLEPIFLHYSRNWDGKQPGEKNNDFLYESFPKLPTRIKRTGWEKIPDVQGMLVEEYSKYNNYRWQSFITWDYLIFNLIKTNPRGLIDTLGMEKWIILIENYMKRLQDG